MSDLFKQVALQEITRRNEALAYARRTLGRDDIEALITEATIESQASIHSFADTLRRKVNEEVLR